MLPTRATVAGSVVLSKLLEMTFAPGITGRSFSGNPGTIAPTVAEVSVIGIPDEYRGQSPKAFIALKAGAATITLDEMKAFLRERIGKHEMIGALEIRAALPKTPVGKLSKKELVDEEAARRAAA